jgi:hypothetical protein
MKTELTSACICLSFIFKPYANEIIPEIATLTLLYSRTGKVFIGIDFACGYVYTDVEYGLDVK